MKVKVVLKPASEVVARLGLDPGGKAQKFHTSNIMRRMEKYMPYRTGATIKTMISQTDISKPEIVLRVPYAQYLYYGKAMKGRAPKAVTNKDLNYTKTKNAQAGPFWDRRLVTAEGDTLARELEKYIKGGK